MTQPGKIILISAALAMLASTILGLAAGCAPETPEVNTPAQVTETPSQEQTFRDYALEMLGEYHNESPSEIYTSQSLDTMLDFAEANESLVSDYDGRGFYILTEFLRDNPNAAKYAVAVDQYVREIDDMIFDYCRIDSLEHRIEGYNNEKFDNEVTIMDAINLNWSSFLPFIESGEATEGEFNFLPRAIFQTDAIERITESEINKERYNENDVTLRQNLMEIAYKNICNFQEISDNARYVAEHDDYVLEVRGYTTEYVLLGWIGTLVSEASAEQAQEDISTLLNYGSESTQKFLKLYASNIAGRRNESKYEENRVELTIVDMWSLPELGLKPFRISADRISSAGNREGHGECAWNLNQDDLYLLEQNSDEELLAPSSPYDGKPSANLLWNRKRLVKEFDKINEITYAINNEGWQTLIELE